MQMGTKAHLSPNIIIKFLMCFHHFSKFLEWKKSEKFEWKNFDTILLICELVNTPVTGLKWDPLIVSWIKIELPYQHCTLNNRAFKFKNLPNYKYSFPPCSI